MSNQPISPLDIANIPKSWDDIPAYLKRWRTYHQQKMAATEDTRDMLPVLEPDDYFDEFGFYIGPPEPSPEPESYPALLDEYIAVLKEMAAALQKAGADTEIFYQFLEEPTDFYRITLARMDGEIKSIRATIKWMLEESGKQEA